MDDVDSLTVRWCWCNMTLNFSTFFDLYITSCFQYYANRLTGKNVSEMTYVVSSGT